MVPVPASHCFDGDRPARVLTRHRISSELVDDLGARAMLVRRTNQIWTNHIIMPTESVGAILRPIGIRRRFRQVVERAAEIIDRQRCTPRPCVYRLARGYWLRCISVLTVFTGPATMIVTWLVGIITPSSQMALEIGQQEARIDLICGDPFQCKAQIVKVIMFSYSCLRSQICLEDKYNL